MTKMQNEQETGAVASKTARCRSQFEQAINHKQLIFYLVI